MEIQVTDLAASREFYVDVLGLVVTAEEENAIYLRSFEEFIHHNLVLRQGHRGGRGVLLPGCAAPRSSTRRKPSTANSAAEWNANKDGSSRNWRFRPRRRPLGFPYE